jgi:hypothetical protein
MTMRYRAKPVEIEAEQFFTDRRPWPAGVCDCSSSGRALPPHVHTMHGGAAQDLADGDYVIPERNSPGHFYPCDRATFEHKYEPVETLMGSDLGEGRRLNSRG